MLNGLVFLGKPLTFENIKIYPPKVEDVITNPHFNVLYKILTMTQDDVIEELKDKLPEEDKRPTPFQYLLIYNKFVNEYSELVKEAFQFFCKATPEFNYDNWEIIIGEGTLKEDTYFDFQNVIRQSCGEKNVNPPEPYDPDEDPRIRRMKEKARQRDRIKAKQGTKDGISLTTCLVAICCMGIGITPLNIGEMSYALIQPIMKMMQEKERYDIDIRSLLAGADSKKVKPKYWIRNIDKD